MPESSNGLLLVLLSTVVVMLIGFGIAFYFQRRTKTAEDWAMGGRSLPSYVIVFTQFATLVGGGVLVGHVSIGFSYGLAPWPTAYAARPAALLWPSLPHGCGKMSLPPSPTLWRRSLGKTAF